MIRQLDVDLRFIIHLGTYRRGIHHGTYHGTRSGNRRRSVSINQSHSLL